jgi:pimeloyl-ACP methyl ester carboxylesterase
LILSDTFGELKTLSEKGLGFSQVAGFKLYKLLGHERYAKGVAAAYKPPFAKKARDYLSAMSLDADFEQLTLARKAINKIDAIQKIEGEGMPTLVMVGDQFGDAFIEINRKIADGIKGSKFVVLNESMDPSNLVNPVAFNREVLAFLKDALA